MFRFLLVLICAPLTAALAQGGAIHLRITSPNRAQFRVIRSSADSTQPPIFGVGTWDILADTSAVSGGPVQTMEVATTDSATIVHVEATQNGRVIASGDGAYVTIRREADAISIGVRSRVPTSLAPRKP
jgi:hypothetical protein